MPEASHQAQHMPAATGAAAPSRLLQQSMKLGPPIAPKPTRPQPPPMLAATGAAAPSTKFGAIGAIEPLHYTNLNNTSKSYLVFKFDNDIQNLFERGLPMTFTNSNGQRQTLSNPYFLGYKPDKIPIFGPYNQSYEKDNAALLKTDKKLHITFSTFKVHTSYQYLLTEFNLDKHMPQQLILNFRGIGYIPNIDADRKFICAFYDMEENPEHVINYINSYILKSLKLILLQNKYIKNERNEWTCPNPNPRSIIINLNEDKDIPQNVVRIESYYDPRDNNEIIRFYYYDPINFHISLTRLISQSQLAANKEAFNTSLSYLFDKIQTEFQKPNIIITNTDKFEFLL